MLGLAACGSKAPDANAPADPAAPVSEGGDSVLNIMVEVEVASLDPKVATDGTSFEVIANYTDGLMQMDADGKAVNAVCAEA